MALFFILLCSDTVILLLIDCKFQLILDYEITGSSEYWPHLTACSIKFTQYSTRKFINEDPSFTLMKLQGKNMYIYY